MIVEGGRWVFKGWTETGRMGKEDMTVQGTWTFVPDLVEDEEPEGKKPTVGGVLPKMGDDLYLVIGMFAIAGATMLAAVRLRRVRGMH